MEAIEVKPNGATHPTDHYSPSWIVMEAKRREVEPDDIVDALLKYKYDKEAIDFTNLCNPGKDVPRVEDYLPTKVVSSHSKVSKEEKERLEAEKEAKAKKEKDNIRDFLKQVHESFHGQ